MSVQIDGIAAGSPAAQSGILPGHWLVTVNGHPIQDILDYRFYTTEKKLALALTDEKGAPYTVEIRKPQYAEPGLLFETYLIDKERSCTNNCTFCFIDQLPKGMRPSLYFKDDDSRLSFLFGNYITLTNLKDADIDRIIAMHISPINISVHTMNPELRVEMMKNRFAGQVLSYIPRLCEAGIRVNVQLVLCPGVNDGAELARSLTELSELGDSLQSASCVPLGLTRYREGLPPMRLFSREEAAQVLDIIGHYGDLALEKYGRRIFFAADEFYLLAEKLLPNEEYYEEFYQLENGVGMLALLEQEFATALALEEARPIKRRVTMVTGVAAFPFIQGMTRRAMEKFPGLQAEVVAIENKFFGETITVAGLVCGGDMIEALRGKSLGSQVLFPAAMLRHDGDLFLDDVSVEQLAHTLGRPVVPVENDGGALLDAILGIETI